MNRKDLEFYLLQYLNSLFIYLSGTFSGDDDIFEAEYLPSYAKTYILPRKMRRSSSVEEDDVTKNGRRKSYERKKSSVNSEFQMTMLKTSMEEKKNSLQVG